MATEKYPVGTVFVQVAPSYADFFNQIGRDSKEFGRAVADEMDRDGEIEKAARKKGKAAGDAMADAMRASTKKAGKEIGDELGSSVERSLRKSAQGAHRELERMLAGANDLTRTQQDAVKRLSRSFRDLSKDSSKDMDAMLRKQRELAGQLDQMADSASSRDMFGFADARKQMDDVEKALKSSLGRREKAETDTLKRLEEARKAAAAAEKAQIKEVEAERKRAATAERERLREQDRAAKARFASLAKWQREMVGQVDKAIDQMGHSTNRKVQDLKKQLETLRLDLSVDDRDIVKAKAKIEALKKTAGDISLDVDVDVDGQARAVAAFKEIDAAAAAVEKRIDIHTGVRNGARTAAELRAIEKAQRSNVLSSRDSANAFRAFNAVMLTAVTLGPALVPVLAAIGGGLIALAGPLAGATAGIGVFLLAFKGIGNAVSELGKAKDSAVTNAKAIANANRAVEDATRNLARTRRSAAESIADSEQAVADAVERAAERQRTADQGVVDARKRSAELMRAATESQRNAEERLTTTKKNARKAEIALADARRQAALDQINLQFQLEQGRLDKDQSRIDVATAEMDYNATMADGSSTTMEREQARINLEQARLRQRQISQANKELAAEKRKSDRQGVEGSDRVKSAQEALTEALKDQRDAQRDVGKAAKEVDKARREGAQLVKEALREQLQVQRENARAIADARKALARTEVSASESVGDAQRNLTRAQEEYADQLKQTSAAADGVALAMSKLSPAGREFALFIHGLRGEFAEIQAIAAEAVLPALQTGMIAVGRAYGDGFRNFVGSIGGVLGDLIAQTSDVLRGPVMRDFFAVFAENTPVFLKLFGETSLSWMQFFSRFLTLAQPLSMEFAEALKDIGDNVLAWSLSKKGTDTLNGFFAYVEKVGPKVRDLFVAFGGAIINLSRALAPLGEAIVAGLTGFFRTVAGMDVGHLRIVAFTLIALFVAFQALTGLTAFIAAIGAAWQSVLFLYTAFLKVKAALAVARGAFIAFNAVLLGTPLGWIVLAIAAVIAAFVLLYWKVDWFRNGVNAAVAAVWNYLKWGWENVLIPVFKAWWSYVQWMWEKIFKPIFSAIGGAFASMGRWIGRTYRNTLFPILDVFWHLIKFIWEKVARPMFGWIGDRFQTMGTVFSVVWKGIKGIFEGFRNWLGKDGFLQDAIRAGLNVIKSLWQGLLATFATPAEFMMKYVINKGIIGGLRWLGDKVGMKEKDLPKPIGIPKQIEQYGAFASGGIPDARKLNIYPGYTPGRDTGHVIGIGGGEAIMRPEWTRAMGSDYVERMNAAARRGGVDGVKKAMGAAFAGAYAKGGTVWPASGARTQHSRLAYPWATWSGDINEPGPQDYGNPVRAYRDGVVAATNRWGHSYGNHIRINHPGNGSTLYAHLSSIGVRPGQKVSAGDLIGRVGSTGNSSGPHLHFEISGGKAILGGDGGGSGDGKGWLAQVGDKLKGIGKGLFDLIKSPIDFLSKRISLDKLADAGMEKGSFLFDALKGVGKKVVDMGVKWIKDKIDVFSEGDHSRPEATDFGDTLVSQSQKRNQEIVKAVAKGYGWAGGTQWKALNALVSKESSWNNLAQNPTSTAFGLFQFLDSTWGGTGVKKSGDAQRQAIAGLKYIDSRYGSPAAALRFHQSHNWYSDGGVVPGGSESSEGEGGDSGVPTMMYDNGGYLPPGITQVVNLTGKPEPVFTDGQFRDMREGGGDGGGDTMVNHFHEVKMTPGDIVDDILWATRMKKMGGKYND